MARQVGSPVGREGFDTVSSNPIFLDTFTSEFSELRPGDRTIAMALQTLARNPRVSTFDRSEHRWVDNLLRMLLQQRLIVEVAERYPWHRFEITNSGKECINEHI
jgi:hypothetical protein